MPTLDVAIDPTRAVSGGRAAQRAIEGVTGASGRMDRSFRSAESRMARFGRSAGVAAGQVRGLLGAFGGALGVRAIVRAADTYQSLQNRIRTTTDSQVELGQRMSQLSGIADRTRSSLDGVVALYQKGSLAADELGASNAELLTFVERVGEALAVEGRSAVQARGALLQLGQALGTGIVRAEEFNSILEGAPILARAAARGIVEAGGSVGKLRQLMLDGVVTSDVFFRGILAGSDDIQQKFSETEVTISQATTRLSNAFTEFTGKIGENGLTGAIVDLLGFITKGIRAFTDMEGGLTFTEKAAVSLAAALGAAGLTAVLAGLVVFIGVPGLITVGLAALAGALAGWFESTEEISESHRKLNQELAGSDTAIQSLIADMVKLKLTGDEAAASQLRLAAVIEATRQLESLTVRERELKSRIGPESSRPKAGALEQFLSGASAGERQPLTQAEKELQATQEAIRSLTGQIELLRNGFTPQGPPPLNRIPSGVGGELAPGAVSIGGGGPGAAGGALNFALFGVQVAGAIAKQLSSQEQARLVAQELAAVQFGQDIAFSVTDTLRQAMFDRDADLKQIAQGFAERLISSLAEAFVFKPLEKLITNFVASIALGAVPSAKGNAFNGSGVMGFAGGGAFGRGSVLTKPTMFALGGGLGVAGEAGEEAALPLKRLRGGILGVNAAGGGQPVQITNNFYVRNEEHLRRTARQVHESQRSRPLSSS